MPSPVTARDVELLKATLLSSDADEDFLRSAVEDAHAAAFTPQADRMHPIHERCVQGRIIHCRIGDLASTRLRAFVESGDAAEQHPVAGEAA
ncbi:fatty acid-CoA racemase domain protein [Mycobacterium xenopi 4042]|uniref:Fatty acid-CoA racemase domain protein n=1 Tax=Mycobacterium xenopi 4042 TaxID=1299334 RepID=X8DLR1_MYCXE|nr:fatty acid-CoA racemase domain protein [Mycobacterium xenopi 4042]